MTHPKASPLLTLSLALTFAAAGTTRAEPPATNVLRLSGVMPSGARSSVTEAWGTLAFTIENLGDEDRDARVAVSYPERPDRRFARDVWVPAGASVSSWLPVGPATEQAFQRRRDLDILLYDRTGGEERLVLPPGEERLRSRAVLYRKREVTTAVVVDSSGDEEGEAPELTEGTPAHETMLLARTFRDAGGLSENVSLFPAGPLPLTPGAFDGIDQLILASGRLVDDPPGLRAVRQWLEQGGRVWVMLDRVDPSAVAPLLGDAGLPAVVDRVGLTTLRLHRRSADSAGAEARDFEKPVELARVVLAGGERVVHMANGWPASFTVPVGRGRVLFTTLGPRGWHRPRGGADPQSPFREQPNLPVAVNALEELVEELKPRADTLRATAPALTSLISSEIGYSVTDRSTAAFVLGTFVVALLAIGLLQRRSRRPELLAWLAPATAVVAAAVFLALGTASRQAVPPTAAAAEVAEAVPGGGEAAVNGVFVTYRPDSGPADLTSDRGGLLELDESGLEGQDRTLVFTDADAWSWKGLSLPAGVRSGPFRASARAGGVGAVARFGRAGVEGRMSAGDYRGAGDAMVLTRTGAALAVRLEADGSFTAGRESLPPGQYVADTVLTDRQQRRQDAYRELLAGPTFGHLAERDALLAWAEPPDLPFSAGTGGRTLATTLLVIPLEFERPAAGSDVTVPGAFIPFRRVVNGKPGRATLESSQATEMDLHFQLPATVLPLRVERAVFRARLHAPGRTFSVAAFDGQTPAPLLKVTSPLEPVRLEISDKRLLQLDADGGVRLLVSVGGREASAATLGKRKVLLEDVWKIESLSLEVSGRTPEGR